MPGALQGCWTAQNRARNHKFLVQHAPYHCLTDWPWASRFPHISSPHLTARPPLPIERRGPKPGNYSLQVALHRWSWNKGKGRAGVSPHLQAMKITPAWIPPALLRFPGAPVRPTDAAAPAPGPERGRRPRPQGLAPSGPPAPPPEQTRAPAGCARMRRRSQPCRADTHRCWNREGRSAIRNGGGLGTPAGGERAGLWALHSRRGAATAPRPPARPFPRRWPMRAAPGAGSRLEPSVARRRPQPFAGGSRPSAAEEGAACREPAAPARRPSPCASRGLRPCPASFPPEESPRPGRPLLPQSSAPLTAGSASPGQPPQQCQVRQRQGRGCQGARGAYGTYPPQVCRR